MPRKIAFTPNLVLNGGINQQGSSTEIDDNQWRDALNVEPLPDGFRRRGGYTRENTNIIPTSGAYYDGAETAGFREIDGAAAIDGIFQGFQLSADADVIAVEVRLRKHSGGSPTDDISVGIHDGLSAIGDFVTGLSTTDFDTVDSATLPTEFEWVRFNVTDQANLVTLTASTQYYVFLRMDNTTTPNTVDIAEDTAGTYASGNFYTANFAPGWTVTTVAASDANFRVLTSSGWVTGIHDYSLSDAATEYHLLLAGQHLYKNVGGTLTPVSGKTRLGFTENKDTLPSMVTANDRVLIANGSDTISKKFYSLSGTEYFENEGIDQPTATPTLTGAGGDPLPNETYEVDYFYWNDDLGIASERRYNGVSAASIATVSQQIDITNLPAAVVRDGDRATHIRIEAKNSTDTFFRYVGQVAIGTTTFSITATNFAARTTEAEYDDQVPPQHSIKLVAENRQFLLGNDDSPWRLYFSKVSDGVAYYESIPSSNFRDFGRGDGDYGTALAFMPPRYVIAGFKNSIWAIDARSPKTSDRQKIASGIGIASHKSFVTIGSTLYFMSDADEHKGMFSWTLGQDEPTHLAGIDDAFADLDATRLRYSSSLYYEPDENRHQWWTTATSSGSNHDRVLCYDRALDSWSIYNYDANVLGLVEEASIAEPFLGQQGYESKADDGVTDAGTAISWSLDTKHFDFGGTGMVKQLRIVDYIARQVVGGAVSMTVECDFGARAGTQASLDYPSAGSVFTLGTSTLGGTDLMGGTAEDEAIRRFVRAAGKLFKFSLSGATEFFFKSMSFGVQGGGRR